jgi:acetate kinase
MAASGFGAGAILTMNGGSSSLKFSVASATRPPRRFLRGAVSSIGTDHPAFAIDRGTGKTDPRPVRASDHAQAANGILARLEAEGVLSTVVAIAHRIVHGGRLGDRSRLVTPALLQELRGLQTLDPDHLPGELAIIEAITARAPAVPQVACFDTAFHRTMPRVARLLAIPRRYQDVGLERYGFHGLSYTFLLEELERSAGAEAARGRVILAHLGAGASLAAVLGGRCVETTMGFTPTSGLPMATRSGDLDPGVLLWLLRNELADADALDDLVNRRSGLLGVSGTTSDMRELLAAEGRDSSAAEAVELFCYQVRKAIGALATTIGGLDTLVFSGGIGDRSSAIRARIAAGLGHLGVAIDERRNEDNAAIISAEGSPCVVRAMVTDEESILEREALAVVEQPALLGEDA